MTPRTSICVVSLVILLLSSSVVSTAQSYPPYPRGGDQRWYPRGGDQMEYLGEARVDGAYDHDYISVNRGRGRFRAMQLRVEGGPIEFERVVVHYGNGANYAMDFREKVFADGRGRVIDLPVDGRIVRGVEIWYARSNPGWGSGWGRRQPMVRLYGIY